MAPGEGTLRARAASLLYPFTSAKSNGHEDKRSDGNTTLSEKSAGAVIQDRPQHHTSGPDAVAQDRVARRDVRAIPGQ